MIRLTEPEVIIVLNIRFQRIPDQPNLITDLAYSQ